MSEEIFGAAWRWNWDESCDGTLVVCKGDHQKHDPCRYQPATEDEARVHDEISEFKRARMLRKEEPLGKEEGRR